MIDGANHRGFLDPFQAVNKIDDTEVSWTLGKMVLYAASEIPPTKTNNLPVGFGSNTAGIPMDWQYAGIPMDHIPPRPNSTWDEPDAEADGWRAALFDGKTPRRIPGMLLFLLIIAIAVFLLCGKDRRNRLFHRFRPSGRYGRRKGGVFASKLALNGQEDRLLEDGGMVDPDDFELGSVADDGGAVYSDDSVAAGKTGLASGWETPRMRTPKAESFRETSTVHHAFSGSGLGLGISAMDRSGLIPRTESRERLGSDDRGRRSGRASPTRRSPMMSSLVED